MVVMTLCRLVRRYGGLFSTMDGIDVGVRLSPLDEGSNVVGLPLAWVGRGSSSGLDTFRD